MSPDTVFTRRSKTPILIPILLVIAAGCLTPLFAQQQLSLADILIALRSKKADITEKNKILADAVKDRGITFALTPEIERELSTTGANGQLIGAIKQRTEPAAEKPNANAATVTEPAKPAVPMETYKQNAAANLEKGLVHQAVSDLNHAIDIDPADAELRIMRATAFVRLKILDLALTDLDKAVELFPSAVNLEARAAVYEKLGNTKAANADHEKAFAIDPKNASAAAAVAKMKSAEEKAPAPKTEAVKAEPAKTESAKTEPVKAEPAKVEPAKVEAPKQVAAKQPEAVVGPVDIGPLNLFATRLVQPNYSSTDKLMRIEGQVKVEITLDEEGKPTSIKAVSGPGTLRNSAEEAVRRSRFESIIVDGKAVKATGYIVFNFKLRQ
ncbi:MAG: TonB family protein [Acidobacteria bacterium]|nr:TonB family protein [Acidobacteriota bacterium]